MLATPIFDQNVVHCFYDKNYDIGILPFASTNNVVAIISANILPNSSYPVADRKIGEYATSKRDSAQYEPTVTLTMIRNHIINGDEVPTSKMVIHKIEDKNTVPEPIEEKSNLSDADFRFIKMQNDNVKRYQELLNSAIAKHKSTSVINRWSRRVQYTQRTIDEIIARSNAGAQRPTATGRSSSTSTSTSVYNPTPAAILQPLWDMRRNPITDDANNTPATFSTRKPRRVRGVRGVIIHHVHNMGSDFESDDSEGESNSSSSNSNSNSNSNNITQESKELSTAREQLSAERMGQNRSSVIQRLRATVNNLENSRVANRQQLIERIDHIPSTIIDESINLARPTGRVTEDNLFEHLQLLQWRDKDEFKMTPNILNKIPLQTLNEMYPIMQQLAGNLKTAIADKTGAVEAMEEEDRNNFLFHVMAKGKDIYYQSLCDPDFCLYLLDNWQPLYSFMQKKLGMTNS